MNENNAMKQLLNEMKSREELRAKEIEDINMELKRIDLRQETETERFQTGIEEDRNAGIYNNITDGKMKQLIDEQLKLIEEKYNQEREALKRKLEELTKKHAEEKANDYKKISDAIKNYHLDMVLESNKEQAKLKEIEAERDNKIKEIDEKIKEKEAQYTHLIIRNRQYMDVGTSVALGEINALNLEIEKLKDEKAQIENEYSTKIEEQNEVIKKCLEQKENAAKFIGSIRLSEKTLDEIDRILFASEYTNPEEELEEGIEEELEEGIEDETTGTVSQNGNASRGTNGVVTQNGNASRGTTGAVTQNGNASRGTTEGTVTGGTATQGRTAEKEFEIFKMQLNISKDGSQLVVQKREKGKYSPRDPEKGKLNKLAKEIGTQDEIIKTEIQKAVEDGILTVDEAKKELDLYEKLTQTDDEKEKETIKDKMKLKLNYDLSGMRKAKLSPDIRRQMRANAAECLKLGIGDVTPTWMKIVVRAEDWYKKSWLGKSVKGLRQKVAGLLTAAKGEENQPETVETPEIETVEKPKIGTVVARKGKTDRLGYRVEKTPAEIEAEATAKKVGEVVEEIQNENKGVEPDQD